VSTESVESPDMGIEIPSDCAPLPSWLEAALGSPREEGWLDSGGCPIHYFRWGDTSKPPVILMHGFLAHARCWAFIAPLLTDHYHLVAFDFSGMGDSGQRHSYTEDVRLQELLDVADGTGMFNHAQKPTLIAHSYAGGIGLLAMEQHNELFSGLILCDVMTLRPERLAQHFKHSGPPGSQDPERPNRVYPDYETAKGRFVLSPPQSVNQACLFDYMAYHSLKQVDGGWSWKFHPSVFRRETDLHEKLIEQAKRIVEAPGRMSMVYGQESLLFDDDSADYIRECGGSSIPMISIANAGHHLMLDEPIAFASTLKAILAQWQA
jgi:pimeloyl-ACP methyl ester carboxylesterase